MTNRQHFVLIVEDDRDAATALAGFLEAQGHSCMIAEDGQEAIDLLHADRRPCLILLDVALPRKNGWQVREAMIADTALGTIPIVFVTGDPGAIDRAKRLSVPVLTKPIDVTRLMKHVTRHC